MRKKVADRSNVVPLRPLAPPIASTNTEVWTWQMPPALREAAQSKDVDRVRWAVRHMISDAATALGEIPAHLLNGGDRERKEFYLDLADILETAPTPGAGSALRRARLALRPIAASSSQVRVAVNVLVAAYLASTWKSAKDRAHVFAQWLERRETNTLAACDAELREELISAVAGHRSWKRIMRALARLSLEPNETSLRTMFEREIRRLSR